MSRAFAIAVLAVGLLSAMDALIKAQAAAFPTPQIALLRFAFGTLFILAAMALARPPRPSLDTILANSWRAVLGVATALTFYYALGRLPLAETLALALLSPCFTALFGALLLGEHVGRPIIKALSIGLIGMLVIVAPKFGGATPSYGALQGSAAVLLSTLTYSLSLVLLRSRATRDHPMTIVAVQNGGSLLLLGAFAPFLPSEFWLPVTARDLFNFAGIGLLGIAGHLVIAKAYSMAPAARLAIADYTALIFAALFGYLFFAETPALTTIAGAALIITASLAATRR
jgi:drug/metabolite transporter (DMT)-like permease